MADASLAMWQLVTTKTLLVTVWPCNSYPELVKPLWLYLSGNTVSRALSTSSTATNYSPFPPTSFLVSLGMSLAWEWDCPGTEPSLGMTVLVLRLDWECKMRDYSENAKEAILGNVAILGTRLTWEQSSPG